MNNEDIEYVYSVLNMAFYYVNKACYMFPVRTKDGKYDFKIVKDCSE